MQRRTTLFVLAVALVAVAVVAVPGVATLDGGDNPTDAPGLGEPAVADDHVDSCAADPPDDFADPDGGNEVVGWVDGVWYNEPLGIDTSDGLNETEVEALGARTSARVEAIRCITADEGTPPIEIQTREEFQSESGGLYGNVSEKDRLSHNAVFETMLTVSSEENSIDLQQSNSNTTVGGFYDPQAERIVIVSDDPDSLLIEEQVLAQEVGHAIQDQQFNLSRYERSTTDVDNGINGLIEGDMNLVDQRYLDACEEDLWNEPCVSESSGDGQQDGQSGGDPPSWGLYLQTWQPYNDGPAFVESLYEEEGWEAVNDLYENPPNSSLYTVHPDTYNEVDLGDVEVSDRSTDEWERITWEDGPSYDTLGVSSISAMFIAPTYETGGQQNVYSPQSFQNIGSDGEIDDTQPLNYAHPETEGWRDDKIYTYRNGDEAGSVWKLQWASAEDAEPFLQSYEQLASIRNGEPVDGYEYTYSFGDGSEWDMALTVVPDGDTVTVVTAPTVEDLTAVHDVELVESDESTPTSTTTPTDDGSDGGDETPTSTDEPTPTPTDGGDDATATETPADTDDDGAGFGVAAGAVAVTLTALVARRRR